MAEELTQERLADLKRQFESIDSDGDGYVTEEELRAHFPDLPDEGVAELDRVADVDADGRFSLEEFIRLSGRS
ncbi:EF-hand domain-containing protein [Microbispora sp. RL4-1S]|uniref:EF-hand domain-containing protein n=1 Tax=Microbispora oryzae TaxID=2806554 RepID=A0A940WSB3_9ACTN|nr:EF-hand domain-containing protein [Microbispora oryzae]MBP2706545.1 EF-hand domain-containing protein [Microbispora oryzae]